MVLIAFLLSCDGFHNRCLQFTSQKSYVRISCVFPAPVMLLASYRFWKCLCRACMLVGGDQNISSSTTDFALQYSLVYLLPMSAPQQSTATWYLPMPHRPLSTVVPTGHFGIPDFSTFPSALQVSAVK